MATFPERALAAVNAALTWLFDAAFVLLGALPPLASLLLASLASGAVILWVVARTSDQPRMAATKRAMHAALFEIRLFNDDLLAVMRALGDILRQNALYLRLSLVPLLWMLIPLVLVVAQLQAFYGYAGLVPGQPVLVKAEARSGSAAAATDGSGGPLVLEAPPGIRVETDAVYLSGSNQVLWRIVPVSEGEYTLTVRAGDRTITKSVHVSNAVARRSPLRGGGLLDQLLHPSEPPLGGEAPLTAIAVAYPEPGLDVLGWRVHWLVPFVALSMAGAFLLARRLGVTL